MCQPSPFMPLFSEASAQCLVESLASVPRRPSSIRLILPWSVEAESFPWSVLAKVEYPQIAWSDAEAGVQALGFGESCIAPGHPLDVTFSLDPKALPQSVVVPWRWAVEPFEKTCPRAAGRPESIPWENLQAGLQWVPRVLIFAHEQTCVVCLHSLTREGESPQVAAQRLMHEAEAAVVSLRAHAPSFALAVPDGQKARASEDPKLLARDNFVKRVAHAQQNLMGGDLEKVVLARAFVCEPPPGEAWDALLTFRALEAPRPRAIVFCVRSSSKRAFVGATPEVLCRLTGRTLTTHAIAGTMPRASAQADDRRLGEALLNSGKDQHEHALVVAFMRQQLTPITNRTLSCDPSPSLLRLPFVQHLVTRMTATVPNGTGALAVARALHPTPAVCGTPTHLAQRYLAQHEDFSRGLYAGFIGFEGPDASGVFAVAIRSMLVTPSVAYVFAGAGLVLGSLPENEQQEVFNKARGQAIALTETRSLSSSEERAV